MRRGDLDQIIAIDARVTGLEKRALLAVDLSPIRVPARGAAVPGGRGRARVVGFVIGEVRDWEFGSPPCGWVFGINVEADARLAGVGTRLLAAIYAGFRRAGVRTVRTMLARDNNLVLSFFRSQGMMTGPFVPLEMELADRDRRPGGEPPAMRLQKNTRLALYSVLEFATDPTRHISAAEIAAKYDVSPHHLAKVLSELARAGVVESVRGVGGGYRFAGNARRLTLMDVIEMFEDFPCRRANGGARRIPGSSPPATRTSCRAAVAALGTVLSEIDEIAKATFRSITLATMLQLILRQPGRRERGNPAQEPECRVHPGPGLAHPPRTESPRARRKPA